MDGPKLNNWLQIIDNASPANTHDYFAGQLENLKMLAPEEAPSSE